MFNFIKKFGSIFESSRDLCKRDLSQFIANLANNRSVIVVRNKRRYGYKNLNDYLIYMVYFDFNLFIACEVFRIKFQDIRLDLIQGYCKKIMLSLGFDSDRIERWHELWDERINTFLYLLENNSDEAYEMIIQDAHQFLRDVNSDSDIAYMLQSYLLFYIDVKKSMYNE